MDILVALTVAAGVFFGMWPLFMNKSNLPGEVSPAIYVTIGLLFYLPMALRSFSKGPLPPINWTMVIASAVSGAVGLMAFTQVLAKASPERAATLYVVTIVVQIIVVALYRIALAGGTITLSRVGGFMSAILTAFLLLRTE